jgi:DNA-binding winged helix-turn-helix (wHTH) protein
MDAAVIEDVVLFGDFRLDRCGGGLFRLNTDGGGSAVSLGSRALDVLSVLVQRAGDLVSKQQIMDAVWPDTAVEENNLTVHISALRRVLDEGRMEGSCIQTVPGRGYRFVLPVRRNEELREVRAQPAVTETPRFAEVSGDHGVATAAAVSALPMPATQRRRRVLSITALAGVCLAIAALLLVARSHNFWLTSPSDRPRLSLVVLPFENLSGDPKDDYLADGITDDLTGDLSHISGAFSRASPLTPTRASPRTCARSARNSACAMYSRAACDGWEPRSGSTSSSFRVKPVRICGQIGSTSRSASWVRGRNR